MTVTDARRIEHGTVVSADLCIIGGGIAGITLARELIGECFRIVLLEGGGERLARRTQLLYRGETAGLPNHATTHSRFRVFGGSGTRWTGQCRPLDPIDFEARDGIPHSGWPFDRRHLEPWYRRAARVCHLASAGFEPGGWREDGPLLPLEDDRLEVRILQFGHPRDFATAYRAELEAAANVDVLLDANVVAILDDADGRRTVEVAVAGLDGRRFRCAARAYVLACGGIENARLLLASNRRAPAGLGNRHDLVGRFFMDHPYLTTGYFVPSDSRYDRGLHIIEDFGRAGIEQRAHAAFALSETVLRRERLNGCAGYFIRQDDYRTRPPYFTPSGAALVHLAEVARRERLAGPGLGRSVRDLAAGWRDAGRTIARHLAERIRPVPRLALRTVLEATPCPESRVVLTGRRDALGMPEVRVDWRLAAEDRRGLERFRAAFASALEQRGLGRLVDDPTEGEHGWPLSMTGGKHHMGTTRMHAHPRRGVVDPDLKVHGLANLYVAGSSVFPTGGWANPTLTIVALTLRLADHLKLRLGSLPAPAPPPGVPEPPPAS